MNSQNMMVFNVELGFTIASPAGFPGARNALPALRRPDSYIGQITKPTPAASQTIAC
jgi:hypothetical protein